MKLPDSTGEIDSRIKILMGGINNLKLLHHFSHSASFEKATKHDELIMLLPGAMDELMILLKKDETHYQSLRRAINEPITTLTTVQEIAQTGPETVN